MEVEIDSLFVIFCSIIPLCCWLGCNIVLTEYNNFTAGMVVLFQAKWPLGGAAAMLFYCSIIIITIIIIININNNNYHH